jgi:TonB family protein
LLFLLSGSALAQTPGNSRRVVVPTARNREIPNATPPFTPDEAKWWQDLQEAAKAVKTRRGREKERQKFLELLQAGQEKSYQPPVPDTKPFILSKAEPTYNDQARAQGINGVVRLDVELRPDGFVGEVNVIKGVGHGLDERAADAARRTIFLPAVKNREFVTYRVLMEMSFLIF